NYRIHPGQMTSNHYTEMLDTDLNYAMAFFRGLPASTKELTGWTEASLSAQLARKRITGQLAAGRRSLLAGEWSAARGQFITALRKGHLRTRTKAMIGLVCALAHHDLEGLIRL